MKETERWTAILSALRSRTGVVLILPATSARQTARALWDDYVSGDTKKTPSVAGRSNRSNRIWHGAG